MVQPGWRSEHLGWIFAPRRGLGPGPMLQRRMFFASTCARGAGGRSSFRLVALNSGSCSCCVGSCNCRTEFLVWAQLWAWRLAPPIAELKQDCMSPPIRGDFLDRWVTDWTTPPHKRGIFHYSASDAFEKQCWSAKGLGCRTEWGQVLTVDLCFSRVSLGNNKIGPPVKDKCFFLLSLCFTKRGGDRVVLIFPPKGMSVERGCYQVVCRKGYQGRLCVACPQCVSSSAFKGCFWISSLPRTSQWPHQSVFFGAFASDVFVSRAVVDCLWSSSSHFFLMCVSLFRSCAWCASVVYVVFSQVEEDVFWGGTWSLACCVF